jgi:hypothetical protein
MVSLFSGDLMTLHQDIRYGQRGLRSPSCLLRQLSSPRILLKAWPARHHGAAFDLLTLYFLLNNI